MTTQPLPIDDFLPAVRAHLLRGRELLLRAEPGAGKTTRVPASLLSEPWASRGEILVAEPRRLAARLAATHVAGELGEQLGERVGYVVRFESAVGSRTQLKYVTAGVLLRRLLSDSGLEGVAAILLDEFHERTIELDTCLALALHARTGPRRDLRLVVMSATLDAAPLARLMPDAPIIDCPGRCYPLTIEHESAPDARPLEKRVVSACRKLLREQPRGDILVFLPGAREIRQATTELQGLATETGACVLPLHGELPLEDQVRAITPAATTKIVLSTNVAESSVTVPGVTAVVDCGTARVARHSPWTGVSLLELCPISRASAAQRAGRAGRLAPGHVLRLYTKGDHDTRPEQEPPEIRRTELSEILLLLRSAGFLDPLALPWLEPPPAAAMDAARTLLQQLDALDDQGTFTPIGARMAALPVAPRLARLIVEGCRRGIARDAALVAALLSERDIRADSRPSGTFGGSPRDIRVGPSDVLELLERFAEARVVGHRDRALTAAGLRPERVRAVDRTRRRLESGLRDESSPPPSDAEWERAVALAVLRAFPDRIARRRREAQAELILCSGETAVLSESSVVRNAPLLVALEVEDSSPLPRRRPVVRLASAIEPEWLLDAWPDRLTLSDELSLNRSSGRVERLSRISYGSVVLEQSQSAASPSPEASTLLVRHALEPGGLGDSQHGEVQEWIARLSLVAQQYPGYDWPKADPTLLAEALECACENLVSLEELSRRPLVGYLEGLLTPQSAQLLAQVTPLYLNLPGRRRMRIRYLRDQLPWVESRLQDFFGMSQSPSICDGRVPLVLHLLAPNQRAVQVTRDLPGFWTKHYPALRRQLMRRYPKHDWPEDPARAAPPQPKPRKT